jgi:hypothetical protein
VLLIEATEQQVSRLQSEMSGWFWEQAPNNWPSNLESKPSDCRFDAVIVFAGKERDDLVIETCRLLCENKSVEGVPLLLAASRYQMSLVNKLRQLPLVDFIFTPIEEDTLLDKIKKNTDVTA